MHGNSYKRTGELVAKCFNFAYQISEEGFEDEGRILNVMYDDVNVGQQRGRPVGGLWSKGINVPAEKMGEYSELCHQQPEASTSSFTSPDMMQEPHITLLHLLSSSTIIFLSIYFGNLYQPS